MKEKSDDRVRRKNGVIAVLAQDSHRHMTRHADLTKNKNLLQMKTDERKNDKFVPYFCVCVSTESFARRAVKNYCRVIIMYLFGKEIPQKTLPSGLVRKYIFVAFQASSRINPIIRSQSLQTCIRVQNLLRPFLRLRRDFLFLTFSTLASIASKRENIMEKK